MIIDLNSFEHERSIDERMTADKIDLELDNAKVVQEVEIAGKVIKSAASTQLQGKLTALLEIVCDRCLEPQTHKLDIKLDLEFVPESSFAEQANLELGSEDMKLDAIGSDEIDVTAVAREQILLNMPLQFFCKEDCQGLCQKCGANLNLQECDCDETEIDPRWAALKNLK